MLEKPGVSLAPLMTSENGFWVLRAATGAGAAAAAADAADAVPAPGATGLTDPLAVVAVAATLAAAAVAATCAASDALRVGPLAQPPRASANAAKTVGRWVGVRRSAFMRMISLKDCAADLLRAGLSHVIT